MLSILFGNHPDLFGAICRFYKPPPGIILDVTYGAGKLYDKGTHEGYKVIGVDLEPNTMRNEKLGLGHEVFQHDLADIEHVQPSVSGPADIMVYDPPYLYGKTGSIFANDRDWKVTRTGEVNWAPQNQIDLAHHVNRIVPVVLKPDGFLVVKISDTHLNKELVMNHKLVHSQMESNCVLVDLLVYVKQNGGFFKRPHTAQISHGYYMIYKRRIP